MAISYRRELDEIRSIENAQDRGFAFQAFVADIFRGLEFEVMENSRAAYPRQTDLVARRGEERYLIEVKWESNKSGIPEIADIRDRLRRSSGSPVGVFISYGGFTKTAVAEALNEPGLPVLLFDGDAVEELASGSREVLRLIDLKKSKLMEDREVHVGGTGRIRFRNRGLPSSQTSFIDSEGNKSAIYSCRGDYSGLVFGTNLVDVDWTISQGRGVSLDLPLGGLSESDLVAVLKDLLEMKWTRKPKYNTERHARWCIQQAETNWHGEGTTEFIRCLKSWKARYEAVERLHHTEEFVYVDACRYGFFTLTGQVSADRRRFIWRSLLSFQLYGIPIDSQMIKSLARRYDDDSVFRPLDRNAVVRRNLRGDAPQRLTPLRLIVQELDGGDWVIGIVIKNFLKGKARAETESDAEALPWCLDQTETLICDLSQWHPLGQKHRYYMQFLEWTTTSEATVLRPVVNWESPSRPNRLREKIPASVKGKGVQSVVFPPLVKA